MDVAGFNRLAKEWNVLARAGVVLDCGLFANKTLLLPFAGGVFILSLPHSLVPVLVRVRANEGT